MAAKIVDNIIAVAVQNQWHAAGAAADRADPQDDMRDRAPLAAANVKQIAGAKHALAVFITLGQGDGAAHRHRASVRLQGGLAVGLAVDGRAEADAKSLVEDEAGQVAAIDPFAVVPGAASLPGPRGRGIPIGNVVVLIAVAPEAGGCGDHAFALPIDGLLAEIGQRLIEARSRPQLPNRRRVCRVYHSLWARNDSRAGSPRSPLSRSPISPSTEWVSSRR